MLSSVFEPFVEQSPICVMARGLMERVLNPDQLNWLYTTSSDVCPSKSFHIGSRR